jgi:hypothetical protein
VRRRAKPSFTVEIKRANKRLRHIASSSGRDQAEALGWANALLVSEPAPVPELRSVLAPAGQAETEAPQSRSGRVLPDLSWVDPVQTRERQEAEERAARRRAIPGTRRRATTGEEPKAQTVLDLTPMTVKASAAEPASEIVVAAEQAAEQLNGPNTPAEALNDTAPEQARKRLGDKGRVYRAAYPKTQRRGLPMPSLPRGERWKRRLPPACW